MWKNNPKMDCLQESEGKLTLPALADGISLSYNKPRPQKDHYVKLNEIFFSLHSNNIARVPLSVRDTMGHFTSRHMEISHWQAHIYELIRRIEREIICVEQAKETAENCLQERQLYSQLLSDCVALSSSLCSEGMRQDPVFLKLKKEEQMTNESREVLQKQIFILLDKLGALKAVRSRLLHDFQDKVEAIKLTTKCITFEVDTPCSHIPAPSIKPNHVSYETWLSHCQNLKLTAENLLKDSSACRANLMFLLANLKDAYERQRNSTAEAIRRKIQELTKLQDSLNLEKQKILQEISDLNKDIQRLLQHIQNCESRLHQITHLLEILNQRPRFELCLDNPHNALVLERQDLAKMLAGLQSVLQLTQQNLAVAQKHLIFVEEKLLKNAQTLDVARKCQALHQSFRLAVDTSVVLGNKPRLCRITQSSSPHPDMQ
ncbi:tektin-4-like [Xiphophorus maculatus]|uniref:tektin-4-like n=1 Tax=Xiphophorus maculatus TaxID=8083 RepID=UPI0006D8F4F8|nr:tektin-4-like [Xiphophorus maculatus]XP_027891173.1 tektin-4-like [Xiphophorus couchianus]